jgi:hypothetical protein
VIPRIATHARAFRVFRGFTRQGMSDPEFLAELGQVFMPGTPLLLRDLGLSAYLPSVLPTVEDVEGVPDEVALIGYPSPAQYEWARQQTIVGRMYAYTHRGVFDMDVSRSQEPSPPASEAPESVRSYWCTGREGDWQGDGHVVFWAGVTNDTAKDFQDAFDAGISRLTTGFSKLGISECIVQSGPTWGVLWLLLDGFSPGDPSALESAVNVELQSAARQIMSTRVTRVPWHNDIPVIDVARGTAWSFIFVRDARHFLD